MALSADRVLVVESVQVKTTNRLPQKDATTVYAGGFAGMSSGYVRPLVAGDTFAGVFTKGQANAAGDGAVDAEVETGHTAHLAVTGVTGVSDYGSVVYASDDGTATLTAGSNSPIGILKRRISGTTCAVALFTEKEAAVYAAALDS